jgi:DNA-binding PadR family transcriptional regulator
MNELSNSRSEDFAEGDMCFSEIDGEVAATSILCDQVNGKNSITKRKTFKKAVRIDGLTGREYHVLRILNSYGWCTAEIVRGIANFHRVHWTFQSGMASRLLRNLKEHGLVQSRKLFDGTKTPAFAVTQNGRSYIRDNGDALLCDTDAEKDPASMFHFVGANRIMLRFVSEFKTNFWMSDFQVRSDNSFIGANGFAKDYDAVGEIVLPEGRVRFSIEYERSKQSADRYTKLSDCLETERLLHMEIVFLDGQASFSSIAPYFKRLGGRAFFVDFDQFLRIGASAFARYWNFDKVYEAPLRNVLEHASRNTVPEYLPIHQLDLRLGK